MSQIPRPGLYGFLSQCHELFPRIVMFTTVNEERFRAIAQLLVEEKYAPAWFDTIEYVKWHGKTKDLRFVSKAVVNEILLVDDFEKYVHPGQEAQWIRVEFFDYPYTGTDAGLADVVHELKARITEGS